MLILYWNIRTVKPYEIYVIFYLKKCLPTAQTSQSEQSQLIWRLAAWLTECTPFTTNISSGLISILRYLCSSSPSVSERSSARTLYMSLSSSLFFWPRCSSGVNQLKRTVGVSQAELEHTGIEYAWTKLLSESQLLYRYKELYWFTGGLSRGWPFDFLRPLPRALSPPQC